MRKLALVLLSSVFLLLTVAHSVSGSSINTIESDSSINGSEKEWYYKEDLRRRNELGLDASDKKIKFAQEQGVRKQGVFLLPEELEYINARNTDYNKIQSQIISLIPEDELYWGYLDQSESLIIVGIPKNEKFNEYKIMLDKLSTDLVTVAVKEATYSFKELSKISDLIFSERDEFPFEIRVGPDVITERVSVSIRPYGEEYAQQLIRRYGDIITVDEAADLQFNSRDGQKVRPLSGGAEITFDSGDPCSIGFMGNIGSSYYLVTAGHCVTSTTLAVDQGGDFIGLAAGTTYGSVNSTTDSALVSIPSSEASKYVWTASGSTGQTLTSVANIDSFLVGTTACLSGKSTENSCGTISKVDYGLDSSLTKAIEASYSSMGGDSGGTVHNGSTLLGVHAASSGGDAYSSAAEYIIDHWGLSF